MPTQPRDRSLAWLWQLYAHTYDGLLSFWPYNDLIRQVVQRTAPPPGARILDLGCGTGNVTRELLGMTDGSIDAVDMSSAMIGRAARKLAHADGSERVCLVVSDALSFLAAAPAASYDRIVSVNLLYTITDQTTLWREMLRCVNPDGFVTVATPIRSGSGSLVSEHRRHSSTRALLHPRLLGVATVDLIINQFARSGRFELQGREPVLGYARSAGATVTDVSYCYGDVDILFTARRSVDNHATDR